MKKPIPNSFELKKVKLIKGGGGGLEVTYTQASQDGRDTLIDEITHKSVTMPHPDLTALFKNQAKVLAKMNNMLSFNLLDKMVSTAKGKESVKHLKPEFELLEKQIIEEIDVTGFTLSGKEEDRKVLISGIHRHMDEAMSLNSPNIRLNGEKWGFEFGLNDDIEDIIVEVQQFLFHGKAAQLDMFADVEEKNEDKEKELAA